MEKKKIMIKNIYLNLKQIKAFWIVKEKRLNFRYELNTFHFKI